MDQTTESRKIPHGDDDKEEASRIQQQSVKNNNTDNDDSQQQQQQQLLLIKNETQNILRLAFPVCGTYLLELLPGTVGMVLVGHVQPSSSSDTTTTHTTKEYLDAACLGVMFFTITGFSIGVGLSTAMDTLCSQAHGANESLRMGIYLQTGLIVLSFAFVLVCILTFFTEEILIALGQPVIVSQLTKEFSLWLLPGIPFLYVYELLRKILQAQNKATPMLIIAIIANLINITLGYIFVYHTSCGWIGAAMARSVSNFSFGLLLHLYVVLWFDGDRFWSGWHLAEAWRGMKVFLSLGIPGLFQVCLEYWAFEILAILCGWMRPTNGGDDPIVAIGANYTLLNITSMIFMIYFGVGSAGGTRIGNALGGGRPARAWLAAQLTIGLNILLAMVFGIVLILLRFVLPRLYTNDEDVIELVSSLLWIGAAFQIADACQESVQGIFRASGRQTMGAILNFVAYYVIGLPLAAFLGFSSFSAHSLGTHGLWIGMSVSLYVIAFVGIILVLRTDWEKLSYDAYKRVALSTPSVSIK